MEESKLSSHDSPLRKSSKASSSAMNKISEMIHSRDHTPSNKKQENLAQSSSNDDNDD